MSERDRHANANQNAESTTELEQARELGDASSAEVDRAGRVAVEPDLSLPGHPEVLAFGDMVRVRDACAGAPQVLPGMDHLPIVRLYYLIGFQNGELVLLRWAYSFFTHGRGARLITEAADIVTTGSPA